MEFPFQSPSRFIQAHKKENMVTTQLPFPVSGKALKSKT